MACSLLIIWLDLNANDNVSSFRDKLVHNQSEYVKIFTDSQTCIEFIQSQVNKVIFFILSGSFGSQVVPIIYDLEQIYQIYLFCGSISAHVSWAVDYTDKMFMFEHEDDLLERVCKEIERYLRQKAKQYIAQADLFKGRAQVFKQESCG
ncbi:hypothetical protein I4U23_006075 [Adineta vaga]|nr:hypothetical protein I4U23_006075 [Adineta vaga]